jgi:hypothetical protein
MKTNHTKISWHYVAFSIFSLYILTFSSCKNDDSNSDQTVAPDVDGFWIINETSTGNCNSSKDSEQNTRILTCKRHNNDLIITMYPNGDIMEGTVNGNNFVWNDTMPTASGNIAYDFSGTFSNNGSQLSGTASWEWYSEFDRCSGTSIISGQKVDEEQADFEGEWHGTWESDEYYMQGTFSATVSQQDTVLSGTIAVPDIGMSGAILTGLICGNVVYFGDVDETIKFVGILDGDNTTGSYSYLSLTDEGSWVAVRE